MPGTGIASYATGDQASRGPLLECTAAGRGGYHRPADQAIGLAEGKAANHSVHTLIHELAHALLAAPAAVPRANENAITSGWRAK